MRPDGRPVPLRRAPRPLRQAQVAGRHLQLPGQERHRVVVQLPAPAREPATGICGIAQSCLPLTQQIPDRLCRPVPAGLPLIFCTYTTDSQTRGYASSLPITTSCSGQSSLTRSRSQPARSPALFDKTRVGSLHVQPNLRASAVPGSLLCGVLNLRDSSCRSGCRPFCPSCCSLLLTSRAYRAWQAVRNVAAKLRLT